MFLNIKVDLAKMVLPGSLAFSGSVVLISLEG